jgi:hypothetical protein
MEEGAMVHHSYDSYAPSTCGSYEPRRANPIIAAAARGECDGAADAHRRKIAVAIAVLAHVVQLALTGVE